MEISDYALEANFLSWDVNALNEYLSTFPAESWQDPDRVMPYILLAEFDSSILNIFSQFEEKLNFDLSASYFIKLKANSVLAKHIDSRNASLNFPLSGDYTSSFVTFYENKTEIVEGYASTTAIDHVYNSKNVPLIYKTSMEHSFHNPTDTDICLLNLSISNTWEEVKSFIDSKSS